ncbi:uncharacterized protein LOC135479056 [Liolophura sinensis]|uniref:uncharacterized protein LOC135479056 n=1 Tax=Liolophura sinensis TaxID=3198878 RepID=UPI0031587A0B
MAPLIQASAPESQSEHKLHLSLYQITACVAGAAIILSLAIVLISCMHKRRTMDKKRRQKLVESLRSGGDSASESSAAASTTGCEPDGGEPEDIKELFYFYWRQGTDIAASRQAFSVELNTRVDERMEEERKRPRRQTVSGDCVGRKMQDKGVLSFNRAPLLDELCQQRRCSDNDAGRVGTPCNRRPTVQHRHHRCVHYRRGISDMGPSPESDEFKTETAAVSEDEDSAKHERRHHLGNPEEVDNNGSEGADHRGTDVSANEHNVDADEPDQEMAMPLVSPLGSETSDDLDLARYIINSNERRRMHRLNSCPEPETNSTIGARTWSFSSLLWTWDFKKSSVVHDIEFPNV